MTMTRVQKKALKQRVRSIIHWQKSELHKLEGVGGRYHFRANRFFKQAVTNLKKEIRLYNRLNLGIK